MNILIESSGSHVASFMIKAIKEAGHRAIASDINPICVGRYLADGFVKFPSYNSLQLWQEIGEIIDKESIDIVIPSFDGTLLGWSKAKYLEFCDYDCKVLISEPDVINTFLDKWNAYQFFVKNNIPTPNTSLDGNYELIKPRLGRGGKGIFRKNKDIDMTNNISQELIKGQEYTVDILCDQESNPLFIIPRKRLSIKDGKSTEGIVEDVKLIEQLTRRICSLKNFRGPINMQCFIKDDGEISVIEINPRIAGGMALGFAASQNWIELFVNILYDIPIKNLADVKYGLRMLRYYDEIFIS